jgi:hypothetical protein
MRREEMKRTETTGIGKEKGRKQDKKEMKMINVQH